MSIKKMKCGLARSIFVVSLSIICVSFITPVAAKYVVTPADEVRFMSWLKHHGVDTSTFELAEFPTGGRGVKSRIEFPIGSVLLHVPTKLVMNLERGYATPLIGPVLKEFHDKFKERFQHHTTQLIAVFVFYELLHIEDSFWAPFLGSIPVPTSLPFYWRY